MKHSIFGRIVKFVISDPVVSNVLSNEIALYPKTNDPGEDVIIYFVDELPLEGVDQYLSPSSHITTRDGFVAKWRACSVYFKRTEKLEIFVKLCKSSMIVKMISMDFKSHTEVVGQILHELVLVPMTFFFKDLAIVHCSSFKRNNKDSKVFLIGGTGGVGKTSTEIVYCSKQNYSFICDDIGVVDTKGHIYPNLSFPKIYAYNTVSNKRLEEIIKAEDTFMARLHWLLMSILRGQNKVRRRVSPKDLYETYETEKNVISDYYILTKSSLSKDILVEKTSVENLTRLTRMVIDNEYSTFFSHIRWHEYNCLANDIKPVITLSEVESRQSRVLSQVFKTLSGRVLQIPKEIKHDDFLVKIDEVLQ